MKVRTDGGSLHTAASWTARIASAGHAVPLLGGVLLTAGEHLTLSATDLEVFGATTLGADAVFEQGQVLVAANLLAAVTKMVGRDDEVTLVATGPTLTVTRGRSRWSLPRMTAEDYPATPELGEELGSVPAEVLRGALRRVLPAVSHDPALRVLTGVEATFAAEQVTFAATDRYRLAVAEVPWQASGPSEQTMVVPAEFLRASLEVLNGGGVTLRGDGNLLGVVTNHHQVMGRLLAEQYLRWRDIIPTPHQVEVTSVTVDTGRMLAAVRGVGVFARPYEPIQLEVDAGTVRLALRPSERSEESGDEVPAEVTGQPTTLCCNPSYLADALGCVGASQAVLSFGDGPTRPFLVRPVGENGAVDDYRHVVMPQHAPPGRAA